MRFLEALEGTHVRDAAQLAAFRSAPATQRFLRRWNLPVYFSLRFQVRRRRPPKVPGSRTVHFGI